MNPFKKKHRFGYDNRKKYEPYGYVKGNFLLGLFIFAIGLIIYGIYKLIEWI